MKVYHEWRIGIDSTTRRANCGDPLTTDPRGERRLRRLVRTDRYPTANQLDAWMNSGAIRRVSNTTVKRTLLHTGLRSRHLMTTPMLTAEHRKQRRRFAQPYLHLTFFDWKRIAFSDKSCFQLHRSNGCWRIRRETSENKHSATVVGRPEAGGDSAIIWVMFSRHCLGPLLPLEHTLSRYGYLSVFADQVHS